MPPSGKFKYISFKTLGDGRRGYFVQYKGCSIGGAHKTLAAAKETLREELGLGSIHDLPIRAAFRPHPRGKDLKSGFRGVSYHKPIKAWVANCITIGKTYPTAEAAAEALRRHVNEQEGSFQGGATGSTVVTTQGRKRKAPPPAVQRPVRRGRLAKPNVEEVLRRTRCLVKYGEAAGPKVGYGVDDLLSSMDHAKKAKGMYEMEPAMQPLSLQSKYRPVKDFYWDAWCGLPKNLRCTPAAKLTTRARAERVRQVLQGTAKALRTSPWSALYPAACNRHRERESGPIHVLKTFGIIERPARGVPSFVLREAADKDEPDDGSRWSLVTSPAKVETGLQQTESFILAWDDAIRQTPPGAPANCAGYLERVTAITTVFRRHSAPRLTAGYLGCWTARAYVRDLMTASGILNLEVGQCTVNGDLPSPGWLFCRPVFLSLRDLIECVIIVRPNC